MIALLQQADFDPTDVDTDLHKRVSAAIQDGFIKRFDMRVSSRDGDQDLSMWMREVEEVVREIMGDTRFAGHQESEVYRGVMRARCYPFKMPEHTFRGTNPQVKIG